MARWAKKGTGESFRAGAGQCCSGLFRHKEFNHRGPALPRVICEPPYFPISHKVPDILIADAQQMSAVAEGALLPSQRSYRLETQQALKTGALEVTPSAVTQTQRTLRLHEFAFLLSVEALNISVFVAWRACVGSKLCWGNLRKHGHLLRGGVEGVEACVPVSDSETDEVFVVAPRPISRRPPYARPSAQVGPLSPTSTHWPAAYTTHPTMSPPPRPPHPSIPTPPSPSQIHR